jgi:hypothetical protein
MKTTEEQIIELLTPIINSEVVNKAAGNKDRYRSIKLELDFNYTDQNPKVEAAIYVGGDFNGGIVRGSTFDEVLKGIAEFDHEVQKKKKIAELKEQLSKLEAV